MEAHISSATQITQKEPKENTKRRVNILNHNGPEVNLHLNTWTCCGAEVDLPNVGLGLVLLPLGYCVGLLSLTFLLCSMIICWCSQKVFPRCWEGRKTFVASWDEMMTDKLNMENVPLVLDQWKIALLHWHIHHHH